MLSALAQNPMYIDPCLTQSGGKFLAKSANFRSTPVLVSHIHVYLKCLLKFKFQDDLYKDNCVEFLLIFR